LRSFVTGPQCCFSPLCFNIKTDIAKHVMSATLSTIYNAASFPKQGAKERLHKAPTALLGRLRSLLTAPSLLLSLLECCWLLSVRLSLLLWCKTCLVPLTIAGTRLLILSI
jgi:hypothetical protein